METRKIFKILKQAGWSFIRQNGSHQQWGKNGLVVTVPAHGKEISLYTGKGILKQAGIK